MFELPKLPYSTDALEPWMSKTTLETHYGKHHATYVKKLNAIVAQKSDLHGKTLEEVIRAGDSGKDAKLFNNAAQSWNHAFFWNCLTPSPQGGPSTGLAGAIEKSFKSVQELRDKFVAEGENHFGSGYVWLTSDAKGALKLSSRHDAQTPVADASVTPILTCDVWEHAYYLDHKNERGAFLKTVFDRLLNWEFAEVQYRAALGDGDVWRYPAPQQENRVKSA